MVTQAGGWGWGLVCLLPATGAGPVIANRVSDDSDISDDSVKGS